MKSVFLVLYLYHSYLNGNATTGGPSLTITPMPSIEVCEEVGSIAKQIVDKQDERTEDCTFCSGVRSNSKAVFKCVEIGPKNTCIQKKN